jgi:hypothetical protein
MKKSILILAVWLAAGAAFGQATGLSGTMFVWPNWTHSKTSAVSGAVVTETLGKLIESPVAFGTNGTVSAPQMSKLARSSGTLTNSASVTLDLQAIANSFGDTLTFTSVQFLAVKSQAQTNFTDALVVGNAASNQFASWAGAVDETVRVLPGGIFVAYAPALGYATASTNGLLKIANSGTNSLVYEIFIAGK